MNASELNQAKVGLVAFTALLIVLFAPSAFSQCGGIELQCVTATATRVKVGASFNVPQTNCKKYFLSETTGAWHYKLTSTCVQNEHAGQDCELTDNGETKSYDPEHLENGDPMPDGCGAKNAKATTTINSGTATIKTSQGRYCNLPWNNNTYTKTTSEPAYWYPPMGDLPIPVCDAGNGVWNPNLPWDNTITYSCTGDYGESYELSLKYKCDSEYTTSMLQAKVDSLSRSRLPSGTGTPPWAKGDPSFSRQLSADESCATQSISKYRFRMQDCRPRQSYTLTWKVNFSGGASITRKITGIRHGPGVWYWPSEDGAVIKENCDWPAGCPNGGMKSVTYTEAALTPE